jgi:hypothetical protein
VTLPLSYSRAFRALYILQTSGERESQAEDFPVHTQNLLLVRVAVPHHCYLTSAVWSTAYICGPQFRPFGM